MCPHVGGLGTEVTPWSPQLSPGFHGNLIPTEGHSRTLEKQRHTREAAATCEGEYVCVCVCVFVHLFTWHKLSPINTTHSVHYTSWCNTSIATRPLARSPATPAFLLDRFPGVMVPTLLATPSVWLAVCPGDVCRAHQEQLLALTEVANQSQQSVGGGFGRADFSLLRAESCLTMTECWLWSRRDNLSKCHSPKLGIKERINCFNLTWTCTKCL